MDTGGDSLDTVTDDFYKGGDEFQEMTNFEKRRGRFDTVGDDFDKGEEDFDKGGDEF